MKPNLRTIICLALFLAAALRPAFSQQGQITTMGTEFWLTFGYQDYPTPELKLVGTVNLTTVKITYTETGVTDSYSLGAGQVVGIDLTAKTANIMTSVTTTGYVINSKTIHIESNEKISVYAINQAYARTDAATILPVEGLGHDYYVMSYGGGYYTAIMAIATENTTTVQIEGQTARTLQKGQVYYFTYGSIPPASSTSTDYTGYRVTADHNIALFVHDYCVYVPLNIYACDGLYEQLMPIDKWGTDFLAPVTVQGVERIRIIASQGNTTVNISPVPPAPAYAYPATSGHHVRYGTTGSITLNEGKFTELEIRQPTHISANKPVAVGHYLVGVEHTLIENNPLIDPKRGDPSLTWMAPLEQSIRTATIVPFVPIGASSLLDKHYMTVIVPTATKDLATVELNRNGTLLPLSGGSWADEPSSGYSVYNYEVVAANSTTTYTFNHPQGLFVMGYGNGDYESYSYLAGASLRSLNPSFYVNDLHYEDINGETICADTARLRAVIFLNVHPAPGHLKWFIDGVEQTLAQDRETWQREISQEMHTIQLKVLDDQSIWHELSTTFLMDCTDARPDTCIAFSGSSTPLDVLANDRFGPCTLASINVAVTMMPASGATVAFDAAKKLVYTSLPGFFGRDSLYYSITCNSITKTAKVLVTVYDKPDNISEADCFVIPSPSNLTMERKGVSDTDVYYLATPFAGDLDNDNRLEVVVPGKQVGSLANTILIFDDSLKLKRTINTPSMPEYSTMTYLIADVDSDGQGEIVVATTNKTLICYSNTGVLKWTSNDTYTVTDGSGDCPSLIVGDIDGDGRAEILAVDKLFDGEHGYRLATLPAGGKGYAAGGPSSYMPVFADVDNDGLQEIVAGNTVYKATINRTNPALSTVSVLAQMPAAEYPDGFTSVADIDLDGDVDVIVTGGTSSPSGVVMYVWDGATPTPIGNKVSIANSSMRISRPFAGDITGNGRPEIAFTWTRAIAAYAYNPGTKLFNQLWQKATSDTSGATTMSMFDFDQNGEVELVYRDETHLRIINIDGNNIDSFACLSATHTEYPIVVDLDRDGHADILVSGGLANTTDVRLLWYGSVTGEWASARKVWNQHAYNSVNINEDLSVPQYPMNPALVFPGINVSNPADDVRPFNSFLQQQTTLNRNGTPLWLAPDMKLLSTTYDYRSQGDSLRIFLTFTNIGNAAAQPPFYITVFRNTVTGAVMAVDSIMIPVNVGDTLHTVITVHRLADFVPFTHLAVRLNSKGTPDFLQQECEFILNEVFDPGSRILRAYDDVKTVQIFRDIEIDALANDVLPPGLYLPLFSLLDSVTVQPRNGTLDVTGTGSNSRFVYNNLGTDSLTNQIDSFCYEFTFYNPDIFDWQTSYATVYIYILQDEQGASACYNSPVNIRLVERPAGVGFDWYTPADVPAGSSAVKTLPAMTADGSWLIQPVAPDGTAPWNRAGGFPKGLFTVHVNGSTPAPMRWTGLISHDWHNPNNWVELHTSGSAVYERPVTWLPSPCTDVTVPSGAPNFPELKAAAVCARITVQDRAMLKNPHALTHAGARVEIRLNSLERDRFVMWSAPLQDMYSGDWHFKDAASQPRWGDVYMNLFQQAHPNGLDPAQADMLTATFGELGMPLPLGVSFNLKVTSTPESRDKLWVFPQSDNSYTDAAHPANPPYLLGRANAGKFITDGVSMTGNLFDLPVVGGDLEGNMVQVVNPYLAYLDVSLFLLQNSDRLATSGYLIWGGNPADGFTAVKTGDAAYRPGMRYVYTGPAPITPEFIPPLQSFFAVKSTPDVYSVKMSPEWTTTTPSGLYGGYQLRAEEEESGVLHIQASQGNSTGYAVLQYDRDAVTEYSGREDVRALFYDENPLTLYLLTPLREPLAISAGSDFQSRTTDLGLRLRNAGEVTLTFTGLERFLHDVYLIDRERGIEVNLQQTPSYTFTVAGTSGAEAISLNDRFTLRMDNVRVRTAPVDPTAWTATALNDGIHVRSTAGVISRLQVYNLVGALVYSTETEASSHRVTVSRGQVYFVTVKIGDMVETRKVAVP